MISTVLLQNDVFSGNLAWLTLTDPQASAAIHTLWRRGQSEDKILNDPLMIYDSDFVFNFPNNVKVTVGVYLKALKHNVCVPF